MHDLFVKETVIDIGKRKDVIKREYFFTPETLPINYRQVVGLGDEVDLSQIENLRVGVTTYENFYSHEELKNMESHIEETEKKSLSNSFMPMTA